MSINAKFIGGPWHGRLVEIRELLPYYEVAQMDDFYLEWDPSAAVEPIEIRAVRYRLYDNWPVKYVLEEAPRDDAPA